MPGLGYLFNKYRFSRDLSRLIKPLHPRPSSHIAKIYKRKVISEADSLRAFDQTDPDCATLSYKLLISVLEKDLTCTDNTKNAKARSYLAMVWYAQLISMSKEEMYCISQEAKRNAELQFNRTIKLIDVYSISKDKHLAEKYAAIGAFDQFWIFVFAVSAMLLLALLPMPGYYYLFLRIVCVYMFGFLAFFNFANSKPIVGLICVSICILFNPVILFHFDKDAWTVIDLFSAIFVIFATYHSKK